MNAPLSRRLSALLPLLPALAGGLLMTSCNSQKSNAQSGSGAYASYPSDGHYNPYPGGPTATKSAPQYQEYTEAPPPPKASQSKSSGSTTASTGSSTKKKSTASSSTKKKSGTSSTASSSKSTGSGTVYVVKSKDTLYGIAKKFHTTVSKLKSVNGLSSDVIRGGQKLKIP